MATLCTKGGAVAAGSQDEDASDHGWSFLQATILVPEVAATLSRRELVVIAERLMLSEEQRAYLEGLFVDYLETCRRSDRQYGPQIVESAKTIVEGGSSSPDFMSAFEQLRLHEEGLSASVAQADDSLLSALSLVLADVQLERMTEIRQYRERRRCLPDAFAIHKAKLDLAQLVEELEPTWEERHTVQEMMRTYEAALTPLVLAADRLCRDNRLEFERIRAELRAMASDPRAANTPLGAARIETLNTQYAGAFRRQGLAQARIAEVNDRFIGPLAMLLPESKRRLFIQRFQSRSYALVYPDPLDPTPVHEAIIHHDALSDDVKLAIQQVWDTYRSVYRRTCDQMERASDQWHRQLAFTGSIDGWLEHNRAMADWTAERQAGSEEVIRKIRILLPPETLEGLDSQLRAWEVLVARQKAYQRTLTRNSPDAR